MNFYDDMQKVANGIFAEFQQGDVVYIEIEPGNGPADDPGESIETRYTLQAAVRGVEYKYIQQNLATESNLQVNHAVEGFDEGGNSVDVEPKINGFVEIDSMRHKIVRVISKPSAGTVVAYSLIVEK